MKTRLLTPTLSPSEEERESTASGEGAACNTRGRVCSPRNEIGAFITACSLLFLTGCAVGPNYSRPAVAAQAGWKEAATATNAAKLPADWWKIFNDDQLNS